MSESEVDRLARMLQTLQSDLTTHRIEHADQFARQTEQIATLQRVTASVQSDVKSLSSAVFDKVPGAVCDDRMGSLERRMDADGERATGTSRFRANVGLAVAAIVGALLASAPGWIQLFQ